MRGDKVQHKTVPGEPKSEKARRQVALPAFVLRALQERRGTGLMFATRNGTSFLYRNIDRQFKKTLVKSGLPCIRFHDLRHTFASIPLTQNVHPKAVQEAVGKLDQALGVAYTPESSDRVDRSEPKDTEFDRFDAIFAVFTPPP